VAATSAGVPGISADAVQDDEAVHEGVQLRCRFQVSLAEFCGRSRMQAVNSGNHLAELHAQ
jgi:hypothetical protein